MYKFTKMIGGRLGRAWNNIYKGSNNADSMVFAPELAEVQRVHMFGKSFSAKSLTDKLWGGYARYAVPALEVIKYDCSETRASRVKAAWELMRWYFHDDDYQKAYENVALINLMYGEKKKKYIFAEVLCLTRLARYREATNLLNIYFEQTGEECDDYFLLKSLLAVHISEETSDVKTAEKVRLQWINRVCHESGLAPIEKKIPNKPLNFLNITARATTKFTQQTQKVSIILPVYNGGKYVSHALDSLLAQTWKNIEIIVINDASTDNTADIINHYSKVDPRIISVSNIENSGAYFSRNVGLRYVTGDLIMVHDADDWSHPQKLEIQIRELNMAPEYVAVMSRWVRVNDNLDVVGTWIPNGGFLSWNLSSLLFKKEILNELIGWDIVYVSGDAEFMDRIISYYGQERVRRLEDYSLLSLSLSRENSLTRKKETHVKTLRFGLRWLYRGAYRYWHSHPAFGTNPAITSERRPIPRILANVTGPIQDKYDIIFISDFGIIGGAFISSINYIQAACRAGYKVAVHHWKRYEFNPSRNLNRELFRVCLEHDVDILSAADEIESEYVFIIYPVIAQHRPDEFPTIDTKHLIVIINQYSSRFIDGADPQYSPSMVRLNLQLLFGQEGTWIPVSYWVHRLMKKDNQYPVPYSSPWYPMIDVGGWCDRPLRWQGASSKSPVIGRHGRDAYTKWPYNISDLKQAYGVGQNWEVRVLGGADIAIERLGMTPENWKIMKFDTVDVKTFLSELDFFIHYPHEDYIEEFGRVVIEAMAVGIPVILPPQFKIIFGDAALYAAPSKVSTLITKLWRSEVAYLNRAKIGRDFVINNCDANSFGDRLKKLQYYENQRN